MQLCTRAQRWTLLSKWQAEGEADRAGTGSRSLETQALGLCLVEALPGWLRHLPSWAASPAPSFRRSAPEGPGEGQHGESGEGAANTRLPLDWTWGAPENQ